MIPPILALVESHMTLKNFSSAVPVIVTADVLSAIRYFEQTLGFKQQWIWGNPPVHAGGAPLYVATIPVWRPRSKNAVSLLTFFYG
jgi:hypothetical protein